MFSIFLQQNNRVLTSKQYTGVGKGEGRFPRGIPPPNDRHNTDIENKGKVVLVYPPTHPPTFNLLRREILPLWRKTLSNQSINLLPHYLTDKWLVWFNRCRDLNCYQKYLYKSYVINIDTADISNQTWTFLYSSNDKPGYNNFAWLHLLRDILT